MKELTQKQIFDYLFNNGIENFIGVPDSTMKHFIDQGFKKNKILIAAKEEDWYTEFLGPIVSIKIVNGLDEAITHIDKYGSNHTDAIVSTNKKSVEKFMNMVDSSSVMINTSTRFADGYEYGLGAEIGISTDKLHARGPVGVEGLTSLKYVVSSQGKIRN